MTARLLADRLTEPIADHGEGPVWLPGTGLAVLDMLEGDVVIVDPDIATTSRHAVSNVVACVRQRRRGGLVAATERGIAFLSETFDLQGEVELWSDHRVRMNEGTCDPDGNLWCGSMAYDLSPGAGQVWQFDTSHQAVPRIGGIGCSNGMGWTRDGQQAYYIDSLTNRVDLIRTDAAGSVLERTAFFDGSGMGFLDGLAVDRHGGIWVALFGEGRLIHLTATGVLDAEIIVPVSQPTSCAFGGPDYDRLFITTSRYDRGRGDRDGGAIFVVEPEVGGFAAFTYAG